MVARPTMTLYREQDDEAATATTHTTTGSVPIVSALVLEDGQEHGEYLPQDITYKDQGRDFDSVVRNSRRHDHHLHYVRPN